MDLSLDLIQVSYYMYVAENWTTIHYCNVLYVYMVKQVLYVCVFQTKRQYHF